MPTYRVRLIPFGRAATEEHEIECSDDGMALVTSHALLADFRAAETWEGERLVCRVTRAGGSASRQPEWASVRS